MRSLPLSLSLLLLLFAALLVLPGIAGAEAAPTPKKLTLAQALATAPPGDGLRLTVAAEKNTLPDGTETPGADADLGAIVDAFGDMTFSFGTVTAIAPATMVVLNTQPDPPNLAADLSPLTALNMLAASLDDTQWQALISEHGLGLADLTDDTQRGLFHALFRNGHLWIGSEDPALLDLPQEQRPDVRDATDQIDTTRVRLGQEANIELHDQAGHIIGFYGDRPDADRRLHTYRPKTPPPAAEHNVALRAATPNTRKSSDLDWNSRTLQVTISTTGLKTVGDLVARVSQRTGLELYVDPHYAGKTVTISGTVNAAPACDLLQALCACVTGTFRQVGPAYVLTDDLLGVGVRRKHLAEWEQEANSASWELRRQAGTLMVKRHAADARKMSSFGDTLAMTPEEMAALPDDPAMPGVPASSGGSYPIAKMPAAQQARVRQAAATYDEERHSGTLPDYLKGDDLTDADLTHNADLQVLYGMQLLVPSESIPVDTNLKYPPFMLFFPGDTPEVNQVYADAEAKELAKLPPAPPLATALHSGIRRAVRGHPRTAADVDALVAAMRKLGLNQLWLDVFSDGVSHVKASGGPDILTEALARTRGTGIDVYAEMSLLSWGSEPPEAIRDLTIDGQTSREAAIKYSQEPGNESFGNDGKLIPFAAPPVEVSPSATLVQSTLTALVQDFSNRPGLAGFVWEDVNNGSEMGYTPQRRLAFLRTAHADPVDIDPGGYLRADASLPLFDDDALDTSLPKRWRKACTDADTALLTALYAAAQHSRNAHLPILMQQEVETGDDLLASWDDPAQPPPALRDLTPGQMMPSSDKTLQATRRVSRIVLRREAVQNDGETTALARTLADDSKSLPTDGFVLDFTHDTVTQGAAPLDSLVRAVSTQNTVK